MPYTTELTWNDDTYLNLLARLASSEESLRALEAQETRLAARAQYLDPLLGQLRGLIQQVNDDGYTDIGTPLSVAADQLSESVTARQIRTERQLTETRSQISGLRANLRRYPEHYDGHRKVTKAKLKQLLSKVDGVDPGSITLNYRTDGRKIIRWVYPNLTMTPDSLSTTRLDYLLGGFVNPHNHRLRIPLPAIAVQVDLNFSTIKFYGVRNQSYAKRFSWGGQKTPHPHILDDNTPCLGDFGAPITEALHQADWETLAVVARMFLETCVTEDGAGRQWVDHAARRSRAHLRLLFSDAPFSIDTEFDGHFAYRFDPSTDERIRTTVTADGSLQLIGGRIGADPSTWGPIGIVDLDCTSTRYD